MSAPVRVSIAADEDRPDNKKRRSQTFSRQHPPIIDKYWMDFIADVCKANAKGTISITGSLAIAMGGWLILNAVATKGPAEFFNSMQTIYTVQLMAIGGVAQHTKATRQTAD